MITTISPFKIFIFSTSFFIKSKTFQEFIPKKVIKSKDEDSIEFNSIEDEIEYLVFTKSWFKEFETITTKHLVENIIEVVYETSEYEEIVSLPIADGNLNSFKPLYRYTFDFKKVVKEFAEKYLFKELIKDSITTGRFFCFSFSNEYCKVNNKYIFSNGLLKQLVTETVDTYQECVKKRESNRKIIEYCFLVEHNLLRFPSFSEKERDEVCTSLLQLKNSISSLNVFKNNEAEKRSILTSLQSLITKTSKV